MTIILGTDVLFVVCNLTKMPPSITLLVVIDTGIGSEAKSSAVETRI